MMFNKDNDIEFQSIETIKSFQEEKLKEALEYLKARSPYYQRVFRRFDTDISQIRHLEDLVKIPFTEKKDLQLYSEDFLCCPRDKVIDYVTTSGTLGDPVTFCCTDKDLERLAWNEAKSFDCAGLKPGDTLQLSQLTMSETRLLENRLVLKIKLQRQLQDLVLTHRLAP